MNNTVRLMLIDLTNEFKDMFSTVYKMNFKGIVTKILMVIVASGCIFWGCQYFNSYFGLDDDNILEEAIENKLKDTTGLDVDLTPDSPE